MSQWLLTLAINYVLTQLAVVGMSVNWDDIKAKANAFVNQFVPAFLAPSIDGVVDAAIDCVSAALKDTADLQTIVADLQAKNWGQALADLELMLTKIVHPSQPKALAVVQSLQKAA